MVQLIFRAGEEHTHHKNQINFTSIMKHITLLLIVFTGLSLSWPLKAEMDVNSGNLQLQTTLSPSIDPNDSFGCYVKNLDTNRAYVLAYEPDASCFFQADLFDANGIAVHKTAFGQQAGSHFNILDPEVGVKDSHLAFSRRSGRAAYLQYSGCEIEALPLPILHSTFNIAACSHLDSALEYFEIISPGEYMLRLRFQVFELTDSKAIKLVRFPPIEVKVTVTPQDLKAKKTTVVHEYIPRSATTPAPIHAQPISSLQVKSSQMLNTPHPTLAFAGYDSPDSALESWMWAICQGDKTNMLQSVVPEMQEGYKHAFDVKTDAQIQDAAARMSAQFSGYTVQKMETISDAEVVLGFTMKGSDAVQKMILKKIGIEWKVAGPSPDSAVISASTPSISVPAHVIINEEKH